MTGQDAGRQPSDAAFAAIAACAAAHFSADGLCAACVDGLLKNACDADEATAKIFLTAQTLRDGLAHAEQRVAGLEAIIRWSLDKLALLARDNAVAAPVANIAGALTQALTPPPPCGVHGCTLPKTHSDEPHSWEHPTHDAPPPAQEEGGRDER